MIINYISYIYLKFDMGNNYPYQNNMGKKSLFLPIS